MATELGKREVPAPVKDWLSEDEVCGLIEVSAGTLAAMIRDGEFPRGIAWRGSKGVRWRWVDVAWYLLGREIAERMERPQPEPAPATEHKPGTTKHKSTTTEHN